MEILIKKNMKYHICDCVSLTAPYLLTDSKVSDCRKCPGNLALLTRSTNSIIGL
jgi:hypothetical protein